MDIYPGIQETLSKFFGRPVGRREAKTLAFGALYGKSEITTVQDFLSKSKEMSDKLSEEVIDEPAYLRRARELAPDEWERPTVPVVRPLGLEYGVTPRKEGWYYNRPIWNKDMETVLYVLNRNGLWCYLDPSGHCLKKVNIIFDEWAGPLERPSK